MKFRTKKSAGASNYIRIGRVASSHKMAKDAGATVGNFIHIRELQVMMQVYIFKTFLQFI